MSVEDILITAMNIEKEGEEFYSRAMMDVEDPVAKDTLRFLAEEEKRHMEFISNVYKSLGKKEEVENIRKQFLNSGIFPDYSGFVSHVRATDRDVEILREAREIEVRSRRFYRKKLKDVTDETEREILEILAREEEKHLRWIEYLQGYVEEHGYWTGINKHFSLDGA